MNRVIRVAMSAGAALFLSVGVAAAADISIVTVGGLRRGIEPIAADFMKETGHKVKFNFTNPANLQKTLASEGPFDVIVVATSTVEELDKSGKLVAGTHVKAVRGGIAVSVKDGAKKPDVSTPEALKAAVLAAKTIAYTDPATPNGSGEKTKKILSDLGIWDIVVAKGKVDGLQQGKEAIARGELELGFFNASEAEAPGCVIVGLVPAPLQQYTNYNAAVLGTAAARDAGAAFVKFLATAAAGERWKAARMEAVGM